MLPLSGDAVTSTLDGALKTAIEGGFTSAAGFIKDIIIIGVPATIGVLGLSKGAKYGIKWISGLFSRA